MSEWKKLKLGEVEMKKGENMEQDIKVYQNAVDIIKASILHSQARAVKAVNQEQLALYYGIGRYVSINTRKKHWGQGAIEAISSQLRKELPGLRGFSARNIKNMRTFYEEWRLLEQQNSAVLTAEIAGINTNSAVATAEIPDDSEIRQLQLVDLPNFPLKEFLSVSFTHHIAILAKAKTYDERIFYMKYADEMDPELLKVLPPKEELQRVFQGNSKKEDEV